MSGRDFVIAQYKVEVLVGEQWVGIGVLSAELGSFLMDHARWSARIGAVRMTISMTKTSERIVALSSHSKQELVSSVTRL